MTNSLDSFAELYCKDRGIVPDWCSARWTAWTVTNPTIEIEYDIEGKRHEEEIDVIEALNLVSKYVLKNSGK